MFSSLIDRVPISNKRNVKELAPVKCETSRATSQGRIHCCSHGMHINDKAPSMYSLALAIYGSGSLCNNVLKTFPNV